MEELEAVRSPIFPIEKDVDVSSDAEPLSQTSSIQVFIRLAEPVVFLQGFNSSQQSEVPPSMLRGSLILRVLKPSKLKNVSLSFKGYSRTEWPEGIPPKRQDFVEICDIVNHVWPFYQSDEHNGALGRTDDNSYLLRQSGASVFKSLETVRNRRKSASSHTPRSSLVDGGVPDSARRRSNSSAATRESAGAGRSLSPMSLLRRAASPAPKHDRSSNLISDLLSSTFSNTGDTFAGGSHSTQNGGDSGTSGSGDHFVFQPGEYIYTFEQAISPSYPESIKSDFGFVEYHLFASIERVGAFKSNITARLPVTLVRTQADSSVEETEPIAISRDWEDQLHYDIVIASKDIILDAFLPIAFHFAPLDKVTLHRIRIYLTETMEYYCRGKKVHRMEPTRKFLLAEHNGPNLSGTENGPTKAKNMGNLLLEQSSGDLVNKDYEYQVFVPSVVSERHVLHPDTAFDKIKSSHWIKLCLRLSKMVDGKRKHYEISIDSPIHVLNKLCSHANTLLPSYDSHIFTNEQAVNACPKFGNTADVNIYHNSNIFFPKEILFSPLLSPEVHSMDFKLAHNVRTSSQKPVRTFDRRSSKTEEDPTFASPRLRSNIYQPETIRRELASPQAIPLSPVTSPLLRSISPWIAPPGFDFDNDEPRNDNDLPINPPSYDDVMRDDTLEDTQKKEISMKVPELPKITLSRSHEGNNEEKKISLTGGTRRSLENSFQGNDKEAEEDGDITSGFSFQGVSRTSPNLPGAVLRSPMMKPININSDVKTPSKSPLGTSLPATVRNDNPIYSGLSEMLDCGLDDFAVKRSVTNESNSSSVGMPSTIDGMAALGNRNNMMPLLHQSESRPNRSLDDLANQSRDSLANYAEPPVDSSVDITALYDRNSTPWHPLQMSLGEALSPVVSPSYSSNVAERNHVIQDFKEALHHNCSSQESAADSVSTLKQNGDVFGSRESPDELHSSDFRFHPSSKRSSAEKQVINEVGREATFSCLQSGFT